ANVTRAHYLLNPKLLDALEAAGIMVWSQAPIYHRDRQLETPAQRAQALATLRGTVLAARSHPSVVTHSVGNELSAVPDTVPGTRAYLAAARAAVAELDPTVPPSVDLLSYPGYRRQKAYARFPLLGINSYFGWYPGKKAHPTGRLADLGPFLDRMRRMYAGSGLVVTEFGAESTFAGPAFEKETYAFQDKYIRDVLHQLDQRPWVGGAIYWTLREFAVKPAWDGGAKRPVPRDAIHNKGLISYAGVRKPAWAIAARDFAGTPLYQSVSPSLAAGLPQGRAGGSPVMLLLVAGLVLVGLVVDLWAVAGILGLRLPARRPVPATAPELNPRSAPAPR
ncbi:MAG: beta-galactosidase, partial [Solirubrobacteraceae bacterium]|nr:beta-galactosidase [Solirubrobacteraceae bacterium]